jgi:hypothetical protein
MNVWTVITDDGNGLTVRLAVTEAQADVLALAWCREQWDEEAHGPMPERWNNAYERLKCGDAYLWIERHDISSHPAILQMRRDAA